MENKKRVACGRCVKAYKLPIEVLGDVGDTCYWCCKKIYDVLEELKEAKGYKK